MTVRAKDFQSRNDWKPLHPGLDTCPECGGTGYHCHDCPDSVILQISQPACPDCGYSHEQDGCEPEDVTVTHADAEGALCEDDGFGCCSMCHVSLDQCPECGGDGYHRHDCPEICHTLTPADIAAADRAMTTP